MMNQKTVIKILKETEPFDVLSEASLFKLSETLKIDYFKPGRRVIRQDAASSQNLYVIVSGTVEITIKDETGAENVLSVMGVRRFFGVSSVFSSGENSITVQAREKLCCLIIQRKTLEKCLLDNPRFSISFSASLARMMRDLFRKIMSEHTTESLRRMESQLFRKKVKNVMSSPAVTCGIDDPVKQAAAFMTQKKVSTLIVLGRDGFPCGVVTETILVEQFVAKSSHAIYDCRVRAVMAPLPENISPDAFVGQALVSMHRTGSKYLVVTQEGALIGIVTRGDLVKTKNSGAMLLTQDIESQPKRVGLRYLSHEINGVLQSLVSENTDVTDILSVMSELHDRLIKRVVYFSEEEMEQADLGKPPVKYALLILGSGARCEQVFMARQNFAVIYLDPETRRCEKTDTYFKKLSEIIASGLMECGFSISDKGISSDGSVRWGSVAQWKERLALKSESSKLEDIQSVSELLDHRTIAGEPALSNEMYEIIYDTLGKSSAINLVNGYLDREYKLPVSSLGTFITDESGEHKNEMNLKQNATDHIVKTLRFLSLKNRISEVSTLNRIRKLAEKRKIKKEDAELLLESFITLMHFRIRENLNKFRKNEIPDDCIDPYSLRKKEKTMLMDALAGVARVKEILKKY